jgi:hypothetical protein
MGTRKTLPLCLKRLDQMSDSLTVGIDQAVELDSHRLAQRVSAVLKVLLNQGDDFLPEFRVTRLSGDSFQSVSALIPGDGLYSFFEDKYLDRGIYFLYNLDPDWGLYSKAPVFQFSITNIKRNVDDMNMVFCLAIAISVAELSGVSKIIDWHGVWGVGANEIPIDRLLDLALNERLPLEQSFGVLYKKIPIRM